MKKERMGRTDADKLETAKSKLEKLKRQSASVYREWKPLDDRLRGIKEDIKYYTGRVEKITVRLNKAGGEI